MSFDDLQQKWQSHDHGAPGKLDPGELLTEVRRSQRAMGAMLLRRDCAEIGAGLLMSGFCGYRVIHFGEWGWSIAALGCLFVGAFMLVDRWIQRRRSVADGESLTTCVQRALAQVEHQIWLLRNVIWWYLLPLGLGVAVLLGSQAWELRAEGLLPLVVLLIAVLICLLVFWGVYRLNQLAVRRNLRPRRDQLVELLASLKDAV